MLYINLEHTSLIGKYIFFFPFRVSHLILVDPWGFPERPQAQTNGGQSQGTEVVKRPTLPRWVKAVAAVVSLFNPLAVIRAAGPWGRLCFVQSCAVLQTRHPDLSARHRCRSRLGEQIPSWFQKEIWRSFWWWHNDAVHLPLQCTNPKASQQMLHMLTFWKVEHNTCSL